MNQSSSGKSKVASHIICTVITANRAAYARTLANSFLEIHPDGKCLVLILDGESGKLDPVQEPFEVLQIGELALHVLSDFQFKYTPFELCCALKPYLMRHLLLVKRAEKVMYLDSDILVLDSLDQIHSALDVHDLVLTPHLDQDLPKDGKKPDDGHVMLSGIFNAGFVGVKNSEEGLKFLNWWAGKLENGCIEDHFNGRFVDQKYLDMVVGLFTNVGIIRDPGCNTAYWNLHSRKITKQGDTWKANGKPLTFYHFSDYRLEKPAEISGHQNRFDFSRMPELKSLYELYRSRLMANGDEICSTWEYTFDSYKNGRKIKPWTRRAYLLNGKYHSQFDPFDSASHPLGFRLRSAWQSVLMLLTRAVHNTLRRP